MVYNVESGGIVTTKKQRITLQQNEDPNLGLSDINDIIVEKNTIPLLKRINMNTDSDFVEVDEVSVFVKLNNKWKLI